MKWQGIFRYLSDKGYEIVMCGRPGHEALYDDYISEYIPIDKSGETDGWRLNGEVPVLPKDILNKYPDYKYMDPTTCMKISKQRFIKYKSDIETPIYDILIHARYTSKSNTNFRNWTINKWEELVSRLKNDGLRIASIGRTGASLSFGDDLRDKSLSYVISLMNNAKLIVGPSSGPMHLASLCGLKHIVFTDDKFQPTIGGTNRDRYEKVWNPLGTECIILKDHNWQPPIDLVYDTIKNGI